MTASTSLPKSISDYFSANDHRNIDAMLVTFADTAVIKDEGKERHGLAAIREWMEETTKKYKPTVKIIDAATADGKHVVTARVSGTFPGSPIDLRYTFTLAGSGKISRLEIVP